MSSFEINVKGVGSQISGGKGNFVFLTFREMLISSLLLHGDRKPDSLANLFFSEIQSRLFEFNKLHAREVFDNLRRVKTEYPARHSFLENACTNEVSGLLESIIT
jgi:hypothetical protein